MSESYERDEAPTQTATEPTDVDRSPPIDAATVVGRFAVLGSIGAGGMGQVFSAYDPQLDRRVALKLLHGVGDEVERQRLIREAQALARLAHPNVVAVHEVGAHEGRVFVAMEFVDGATLRDWMDAHPPGPTERLVRALELLLEAGRGIQAAHAAGLVHRDIKPRNILVGTDGRVRVVDFGLARTHGGEAEEMLSTARGDASEREDPLGGASGSGPLLSAALTQTGSVLGTPAYMAPEQFRRGPVDHAADQFAFCVTAWEVLFGARPFGGTVATMLLAIHDGAIERPAGVDVPAEIERALRRGLAQNASRRHRDMTALLGVLEDALATAKGATRARGGSRRGWMIAGGLAVVASGAAFWLGAREVARCEGAEEKFAGVWDPARKDEIRSAVVGTGASFAEGAWTRLEANVDAWRVEWIDGHRDACEATQVRGEQSARLMDLRMSCLDSRRQRLAAYLDLLGDATTEVVANADDGFASLPSIERCADVAYVEHRGQRSEDPEVAAIEDEVLSEVARANTLQAAGDYEGALVIAEAAAAKADAAGSDLARAHALLAQGVAMATLHRPDAALEALADAYRYARANGIGEVAVDASRRAAVGPGWRSTDSTTAVGGSRSRRSRRSRVAPKKRSSAPRSPMRSSSRRQATTTKRERDWSRHSGSRLRRAGRTPTRCAPSGSLKSSSASSMPGSASSWRRA
jgi:tetratricopeptide (TPR) repeat protein/predicted Ser/Thr protein kinase